MNGPLWAQLDDQPRWPVAQLLRSEVPTGPGVYAWYRDGVAMYSGRAAGRSGLRGRVWSNHLQTGPDLSRSSFRRNVCEHLGIAPAAVTKARPSRMTVEDIEPVNAWIRQCEVSWLLCSSPDSAKDLERRLHAEWMPALSRR